MPKFLILLFLQCITMYNWLHTNHATIWMIVGQGPIALAVGAVGGCSDILLSSVLSLLFLPLSGRSLSLGDGPI